MDLTADDVEEMLRLLEASAYDELELKTERYRLVLTRGQHGGWIQEIETLARPNMIGSAAPAAASNQARRNEASEHGLVDVSPPLPGTFYRAPKPGAAPFVEIGGQVSEDTVIAIIETMKLMNSAHAGAPGEIVEICVNNGEFVELGSVLMRIRPRAA